MNSKENLAHSIISNLHSKGFEAYLAGGCVRDKLRGAEPKDFDIATSATPEEIQKTFEKTVPVGIQFGVILVVLEGTPFEVATFRTDAEYEDGRRPKSVSFTSIEEDAKRRDFTVNGLYFDIKSKKILDFVGGEADLKKKLIRTIGDPKKRFLEDHLRMIRAVRFAVQLEFEIDPAITKVISENAPLVSKVSAERIRDEFSKTLTSPNPARGVRLLDELGLLKHFLPEVDEMKGVAQPAEYHPEGDVYIHTLMLLEQLSEPEIELAMGALLHDISKPETFEQAEDRIRFHGHDVKGAEKSYKICKRLAFSNAQIELICELVRQHLKFKDAKVMRESTLRRFFALPRFDLHMALHKIDCMASHKDLTAHAFCEEKLSAFAKEPPRPVQIIKGRDLIEMGYSPGPKMGDMLKELEDEILEGRVKTKEEAMAFIRGQFPKS